MCKEEGLIKMAQGAFGNICPFCVCLLCACTCPHSLCASSHVFTRLPFVRARCVPVCAWLSVCAWLAHTFGCARFEVTAASCPCCWEAHPRNTYLCRL